MSQVQVPPSAITTGRDTQGQAEPRLPTQSEVDDYEREATELGAYQEREAGTRDEDHAGSSHYYPIINKQETSRDKATWLRAVSSFWTRYIRLSVPHEDCRDHLANERTFLAYLRTSLALSTSGVTVSQLLRLAHSVDPDQFFGYYVLGRPLGAMFQVAAMILALIGAHRFWRQQMSMARGKVWASGWEIYTIWGLLLALMTGVMILLVVVDIDKEDV
ncbi:hypothetical protein MBLNU457_3190t1 [Dothideomycetes sp. NU457]